MSPERQRPAAMASSAGACFALFAAAVALPRVSAIRDSFESGFGLDLSDYREREIGTHVQDNTVRGMANWPLHLKQDLGMFEDKRGGPEDYKLQFTELGISFDAHAKVTVVEKGSIGYKQGCRPKWILKAIGPAKDSMKWRFDEKNASAEIAKLLKLLQHAVWAKGFNEEKMNNKKKEAAAPAAPALEKVWLKFSEEGIPRMVFYLGEDDSNEALRVAEERLIEAKSTGNIEELEEVIKDIGKAKGTWNDRKMPEENAHWLQARQMLQQLKDKKGARDWLSSLSQRQEVQAMEIRSAIEEAERVNIPDEDLASHRVALQLLDARESGEPVVVVSKPVGQVWSALGLQVKASGSGRELEVESITSGGVIEDYNNLSRLEIRATDLITVVNGRSGDHSAMTRELERAEKAIISFKSAQDEEDRNFAATPMPSDWSTAPYEADPTKEDGGWVSVKEGASCFLPARLLEDGEKPMKFTITVTKPEGAPQDWAEWLGLVVGGEFNKQAIKVLQIKDRGALSDHNKESPIKVLPGDFIVPVNTESWLMGNLAAKLAEVQAGEGVTLHLERFKDSTKSRAAAARPRLHRSPEPEHREPSPPRIETDRVGQATQVIAGEPGEFSVTLKRASQRPGWVDALGIEVINTKEADLVVVSNITRDAGKPIFAHNHDAHTLRSEKVRVNDRIMAIHNEAGEHARGYGDNILRVLESNASEMVTLTLKHPEHWRKMALKKWWSGPNFR